MKIRHPKDMMAEPFGFITTIKKVQRRKLTFPHNLYFKLKFYFGVMLLGGS